MRLIKIKGRNMATPKLLSIQNGFRTVINLSELPPSCYTDGSLCGYFLTEFCPLKEVLRDGGVIESC